MTKGVSIILTIILLCGCTNKITSQIKEGNYYIYSNSFFLALTNYKNNDGTSKLTTESKSDKFNKNQIWQLKKNAKGYTLKNVGTSEFIDVYGNSQDEGSEINTYAETGNENQIFSFEKKDNYYIIKGVSSKKNISVYDYRRKAGSEIIQRERDTSEDEKWRLTPADSQIIPYDKSALTVLESEFDNNNKKYTINPVPNRNAESFRMGRFAPADYVPAGIYITKGEQISIEVSGLNPLSEDFLLLVGEPNAYWGNKKENNPYQHVLKNGTNNLIPTRSGLLYFNYTNHPFQFYKNNTVQLKITQGGIISPLFLCNKTTSSDWGNQLKSSSPFVQFLSEKAIITIKKNTLRKHRNADLNKTFEVLHEVLEHSNDLAGFDNSSFLNTVTPLRTHYVEDDITTDTVYKNGVYMYAGDIFIGMQPDGVGDLINDDLLVKQWAIWHETGHLFQMDDWTWSEMGEVTVNLFSLNVQEKFGNKSRIYEPNEDDGKTVSEAAKKYLKNKNKKFIVGDDGEMNFVCLVMFEQLRKSFGNKFYAQLNKFYRKNPLTFSQINDENEVMQEFMFNSCKISGYDLSAFFQEWGLPISNKNFTRINKLNLPASKSEILSYFVE